MGKLFVSAGVALACGLVCFFLSVAFLCFVLLIYGFVTHSHPDMTLTYRVAAPVAVLATITGFVVTLVRVVRSALAGK